MGIKRTAQAGKVIDNLDSLLMEGTCGRRTQLTLRPPVIVHNAKVSTLNEAQPQASAFAIRGEKFVAVGNDEEIMLLRGNDTRVDTGGGGHAFPVDYHASTSLAAQPKLPLRISYYLFAQNAGSELEAFRQSFLSTLSMFS